MLLAGEQRRVLKDGIHFRGLIYFADALYGRVGETVEVRAMPHDRRQIEIYATGRWLATRRPQGALSDERRAARARSADKRDATELARREPPPRAARTRAAGADHRPRRRPGDDGGHRARNRDTLQRSSRRRRGRCVVGRATNLLGRAARVRDAAPLSGPGGTGTIDTEPFLLAERAVARPVAREAMGAVHGEAGTGKTFAVDEARVDALICGTPRAVPEPANDAAGRQTLLAAAIRSSAAANAIGSSSPTGCWMSLADRDW